MTNNSGTFEIWQVDLSTGDRLFCLGQRWTYRDALEELERLRETHPSDLTQGLVIVPPEGP